LTAVWHQDLPSQLLRSTLRKFMDVTEDLGAAMTTIAPQDLEEDPDLVVVTPNICKAAFPFLLAHSGDPAPK
jgi:hypothetical protein